MSEWVWNPKTKDSGVVTCIPQTGICPMKCDDCFFQSGRSYLEPLDKTLPRVPSDRLANGRVVRVNDGNDSNHKFDLVVEKTKHFQDKFYNTSMNKNLDKFPGPIVLTVNPAKMTDTDFHRVGPIPTNLMFVRVRVNSWNLENVVLPAIRYYTEKEVPVVLTYMAYYKEDIPEEYSSLYTYKKRTTNSYYVLNEKGRKAIVDLEDKNPFVYECGYKGTFSCSRCGNCLREYYNTKERLRNGETEL
jgi:hypothetical protein